MLASAVKHLVKGIVENPDDVKVAVRSNNRGEVLEVHVNPEDLGRVIGRSGRTAKAIRTVVNALADGRNVRVDVVDTDANVTAETRQTQLRVGRLTKAHGLKGAIKVELYTDEPEKRFVPGAIFSLQVPEESPWHGKNIELVELRWYNSHPVAFFKDVPDRTAAESLIKAILWVDHDTSVLPDEPEAWYDHQLTGLKAVRDGVEVGTIARVDHFPAQDLLVVKTANGDVMVPFVKAIVPEVDIEKGIVTLTPPGGLFEELPEDDDDVIAEETTEA